MDEWSERPDLRAAAEMVRLPSGPEPGPDFTRLVMERVRGRALRPGIIRGGSIFQGYTWADLALTLVLVGLFNLALGLSLAYALSRGTAFFAARAWMVWSLGTALFFLVLGIFSWLGNGSRARLVRWLLVIYAAAAMVYGLSAQAATGPMVGFSASAAYTLAMVCLIGVLTFLMHSAAVSRPESRRAPS